MSLTTRSSLKGASAPAFNRLMHSDGEITKRETAQMELNMVDSNWYTVMAYSDDGHEHCVGTLSPYCLAHLTTAFRAMVIGMLGQRYVAFNIETTRGGFSQHGIDDWPEAMEWLTHDYICSLRSEDV